MAEAMTDARSSLPVGAVDYRPYVLGSRLNANLLGAADYLRDENIVCFVPLRLMAVLLGWTCGSLSLAFSKYRIFCTS